MNVTKHLRLVLLGVLMVALSTATGAVPASAATIGSCEPLGDAADSAATAGPIETPAACVGQLSTSSDEDWFAFSVAQGESIRIGFPSDQLAGGHLIDPNGFENEGTACAEYACYLFFADPGTWKFGLTNGLITNYSIEITLVTPPPTPYYCEQGGDVSDNSASPKVLVSPTTCAGTVGGNLEHKVWMSPTWDGGVTDEDWYAFTNPAGGSFSLTVKQIPPPIFAPPVIVEYVPEEDLMITLYNSSGQDVTMADCTETSVDHGTHGFECVGALAPGGTWLFGLREKPSSVNSQNAYEIDLATVM